MNFTYFATFGRGTFEFVQKELNSFKENIEILDFVEGKIQFKSNEASNELKDKLKTIERLFICFLFHKFNKNCNSDEILKMINDIKLNDIDTAINLTQENESDLGESKAKRAKNSIKYRFNLKLTGKWRRNSSIQKEITNIIINKLSERFEADLKEPQIEFICHLSELCLAFGVPVTKQPLSLRLYIKHIGLRSTVCAIMLQLSGILEKAEQQKTSKIILDPFCGKSTIFMEYFGSMQNPSNHLFIACDMMQEQLDASLENVAEVQNKDISHLLFIKSCLLPGSCFPFANSAADIIITDLPFGIKHQQFGFSSAKDFYSLILREFLRLLNEVDAFLVVLVNSNEVEFFEDAVKSERFEEYFFEAKEKHKLSLGETNATVFKLLKKIQ